jgi:hypothetical protein
MIPSTKKDSSRRSDLGIGETARTLHCMPQHVYNLIRGGILQAEKVNNKWRVSRDSVELRQRTVRDSMATTRRFEDVLEPEGRAASYGAQSQS